MLYSVYVKVEKLYRDSKTFLLCSVQVLQTSLTPRQRIDHLCLNLFKAYAVQTEEPMQVARMQESDKRKILHRASQGCP